MAVTIRHLAQWKQAGEKFTMLTAYDYSLARLVAQAGIPVILVGDSLGQVILGHRTTLPVTVDDIIHHSAAVVRGAPEALVVADMPFGSYQVSQEEAVRNAVRLIRESGAQAVKLEGGEDMAPVIAAISRADIAVMAHIGLTPQAVHRLGGYRTQAVDPAGLQQLLADAQAVAQAGAFAMVIEKVPDAAAADVTRSVGIPTISCGSGPDCDGQVLVTYDLLGLFGDFTPPFAKRYADLGKAAVQAMTRFAADVRGRRFPPAAATAERKPTASRPRRRKP